MVGLVADGCLIVRKTCQRRPDSLLGTIRKWVLNCMETLSCHSNQSAYATAIKAIVFVEANAMNSSAKSQLYP